jgi:hypothetical protein
MDHLLGDLLAVAFLTACVLAIFWWLKDDL